jgi:DNA-binding NtrC family response regulator
MSRTALRFTTMLKNLVYRFRAGRFLIIMADKEDLEEVMLKKIMPLVEATTQKFLGVKIEELNTDISSRLKRSMILGFDMDTRLSFRAAKEKFKREYLQRLLNNRYGNISDVAKLAKVNRRTVHRIVKKQHINVDELRKNMYKPGYLLEQEVGTMIAKVFDDYKGVIHPTKLENVYRNVDAISKNLLSEIPEQPMTLKEAIMEFEERFLRKALNESNMDMKIASKKLRIRYETLLRKAKRYKIIQN